MQKKVKEVLDALDGKIILTEEEIEQCKVAVNKTYQAIAADASLEYKPVNEILEVVLDAGYVKMYGGMPNELYKKFDSWVTQELEVGRKMKLGWKASLNRIAKVIW